MWVFILLDFIILLTAQVLR